MRDDLQHHSLDQAQHHPQHQAQVHPPAHATRPPRQPQDRMADFVMTHPLQVRWAEVDMQGVVFNPHYLAWFDIAITEYWRAIAGGQLADMGETLHRIFVARTTLDWHASARFDDALLLATRCLRLGRSSFTMRFVIARDSVPLVTGETVYVHAIDGRSSPLPVPLRQRIVAYERIPPQDPDAAPEG